MKVSADRLRELLQYNPKTGLFIHRVGRKGGGTRAGNVAGRVRPHDGYCRIGLDYNRYFAHQLAWLFMTGDWPPSDIDHINGQRDDNRFSNLRLCSKTENMANTKRPKTNSSGLKGVNWHGKAGKWRATIKKNRTPIHIGYFTSAAEAHVAYIAKAKELFGEFARAG